MTNLKTLLLLIFFVTIGINAQEQETENKWEPFEYFIGSWQGHETGVAGIGKGARTYEKIMNGTYLYFRNTSTFEPQEKNPKGEKHEDQTYFSYDEINNNYVIRQFNSEGYINKFVLDSLSADNKYFVFVSESSENAPPDLRARIIYSIQNENEFIETFELAFPKKDFQLFLKNYWKRLE